jgi:CubicO group peptidase (beta-lactamase class C family)
LRLFDARAHPAAMTRPLAVLAAVSLLVTPALAAQAAAPLTQQQLTDRLGRALDSLAALGEFSGAVGMTRAGLTVFEGAYGMADRATKRPNTVKTEFNIGSINKVFTETAIRQLAAEGKLNLDSTLGHYWPDYPSAPARTATIRQLMTHQAGLGGNIFDPPPGGTRNDIKHNNDYLQLFVSEPQAFAPGTSRRYCNACYVVLGMLIEKVSGDDYYAYIQRHVYAPAGMTHTGSYKLDSLPPNTAIGYTRGEEDAPANAPVHANTTELPGRGSAAGGGYSTIGDLLQFVAALRERKVPSGPPAGLGVAGGSGGLNAVLEGDLPGGYDLAVAANLDPPAAERIAELVRAWLGASDGPGPGPGPRPGPAPGPKT